MHEASNEGPEQLAYKNIMHGCYPKWLSIWVRLYSIYKSSCQSHIIVVLDSNPFLFILYYSKNASEQGNKEKGVFDGK